jgi:hypothetical protein
MKTRETFSRCAVALLVACTPKVGRPIAGPEGLSGLTRGDGSLWAVSERDEALLRFSENGEGTRIPISGVPAGIDLESIEWIGQDEFVLGTEGRGTRASDRVLWVRVHGSNATVLRSLSIPYAHWDTFVPSNQGWEAICRLPDAALLLANEHVLVEGSHRYAIAAVVSGEDVVPLRIRVTTATGKISALTCERGIYAIERHYGVGRIVTFTLAEPEARLVAELPPDYLAHNNPEGLVEGDGGFWVLSDNSGSRDDARLLWVATPD